MCATSASATSALLRLDRGSASRASRRARELAVHRLGEPDDAPVFVVGPAVSRRRIGSSVGAAVEAGEVSMTRHISAAQAAEIDEKLMGSEYGFTLEQLMELAGLSVAAATREVYPPETHRRVLCLCGPGNNGGDGLVAARHLFHFGYDVSVCYPKRSGREPIYARLTTQLETLSVPFVDVAALTVPAGENEENNTLATTYDVVVDGVFGFSFAGSPRAPFDALLNLINPARKPPPIVAIDVPSGWSVDEGDASPGKSGARPEMLVSLTAPKLCSKTFDGAHHFVGGRFLPPKLAAEYGLVLPEYEGANQCTRVSSER